MPRNVNTAHGLPDELKVPTLRGRNPDIEGDGLIYINVAETIRPHLDALEKLSDKGSRIGILKAMLKEINKPRSLGSRIKYEIAKVMNPEDEEKKTEIIDKRIMDKAKEMQGNATFENLEDINPKVLPNYFYFYILYNYTLEMFYK